MELAGPIALTPFLSSGQIRTNEIEMIAKKQQLREQRSRGRQTRKARMKGEYEGKNRAGKKDLGSVMSIPYLHFYVNGHGTWNAPVG